MKFFFFQVVVYIAVGHLFETSSFRLISAQLSFQFFRRKSFVFAARTRLFPFLIRKTHVLRYAPLSRAYVFLQKSKRHFFSKCDARTDRKKRRKKNESRECSIKWLFVVFFLLLRFYSAFALRVCLIAGDYLARVMSEQATASIARLQCIIYWLNTK